MNDAQVPGALPVYHESGEPGDGIDSEAPEFLSPDQMERHIAAVTKALESYGLQVNVPNRREPSHLDVEHPAGRSDVELWLHDDRAAMWTMSGETSEGTTSTQLAAHIAHVLGLPDPS